MEKKFKLESGEKINRLPKKTGVYCFKEKEILYIGKASNIQGRVKNHFQQPGYKDYLFFDKIKKIGYIKTNSEIEALILEANLIKKYQPKYNVIWRDDKNYFFVGITKEDFPIIFITHQPKGKLETGNWKLEINYVGPFVDGKALKQALKILRRVFPYRSCKVLPRKPCLWYQLKRCPAPCLLKSNLGKQIPSVGIQLEKECQKNARNIIRILKEKEVQVLRNLKKEMKRVAKSQDFERAAEIRDQISALEKILAHSKIFEPEIKNFAKWREIEKEIQLLLKTKGEISRIEAYDISNISGKFATGSMVTFIKGQHQKKFYRRFKIKFTEKPNDISMLKEVLSRRFNHPEWGWPDLILIDGGIAQLNAALKVKNQGAKGKGVRVAALAKKRNELYIENQKKPILLKNLPREIFNLLLQLRDEAHRFALVYHRKLRKKVLLTSN